MKAKKATSYSRDESIVRRLWQLLTSSQPSSYLSNFAMQLTNGRSGRGVSVDGTGRSRVKQRHEAFSVVGHKRL